MHRRLLSFLKKLFQELFPCSCCVCNGVLIKDEEIERGLCTLCYSELVPLKAPLCESCGIPLSSEDVFCLSCRDFGSALPAVHQLRSVFLYAGTGPELLHAYKTSGAKPLALLWAKHLCPMLEQLWSNNTMIVPVPSLLKNRRARGFDQIQLIIKQLPQKYQNEASTLLVRAHSNAQKTLNRVERQTNLSGKIKAYKKIAGNKRMILLDDICTTGATLSICAAVLRAAGAGEVCALTLFRD